MIARPRHLLKTPCYVILLVVSILSEHAVGQTQDVTDPLNIGMPPNGVFSGSDFDSVQLNNGGLHIEIPLWSIGGRGLSVGYKYIYDNRGWYFRTTCSRQGLCTDHVSIA